ncbi:hypothetical protein [Sandaracinus amylolyticus]|uniref:Lipoprotein n=1 Tax=Sandaracinus amylolyticus TaxID=927083 RepID=A0A0F6W7H4_9BACT|nr:hypothetical protein [Sandaracinus amylolyticus]AKF09392.1 hypothetical protein DB32_006541 [Sandaracinus amylolyticus]
MTRLVRLLPLVLVALLALTGCHRRARATATVAQPATSGGVVATSISHRHYRNLLRIASRDTQCHHRELSAQEVSPGIFSISGCGQLRDYVMVCSGRRHCRWVGIQPVEAVAIAETQCATGQVVVQPTGPLSRTVSACGQTLQYALACAPGACAWSRGAVAGGVVMQTEPGTAVIVVPDAYASPSQQVQVQEASTAGVVGDESADVVQIDAAGTLQSLLATQIAAIRQCTGGAPVTLAIRWTAQGQVGVALAPPHAGTQVEACVQAAVGSVVLQGVSGPGQVQASF